MEKGVNELSIEELVQRLYAFENSGNTKSIEETHRMLMEYQKSDKSMEYADVCMRSLDFNVQFFGILMFQMKINSDWDFFQKNEKISLFMNLLKWLKAYVDRPIVIIRKLVSTLSIFALKTIPELWTRPIHHLMAFFVFEEPIESSNMTSIPDTNQLLELLDYKQKKVLLMFSSSFLEEIEKSDISSSKRLQLHQVIQDSSTDIGLLLKYCFELSPRNNQSIEIISEAMHCFQIWVFYSSGSNFTLQSILCAPDNIFESMVSYLLHEETFLMTANTLNEIISYSPKLLSGELMNEIQKILYNYWKDINFVKIFEENGEFNEYITSLSYLIITLCEANIDFFFHHLDDRNSKIFIGMMLDLLGLPAFAVFQEDISVQTLEFFTLFMEMFNELFSQENVDSGVIDYGKNIAKKIFEICLVKLRWPPRNLLENYSKDICEKFILYRRDIGDLLETIFSFLKEELIEKAVNFLDYLLLEILNWEDIEAVIFSLVYVSEVYPEEESESDKYIYRVFSSNLFSVLSSSYFQVKYTALKLAGSYGSFIKRHPSLIPSVLAFLFSYLEDPELSYVSSKSIYKLSSYCRFLITKELSTFLSIFKRISHNLTFSFNTKYKIFAAITCIIQSLPENEQIEPLDILIQKIVQDLELAQSLRFKHYDKSVNLTLSCINCMTFIGKSLNSDTMVDKYNSTKLNNNLIHLTDNKFITTRLMEIFLVAEEIYNIENNIDVLKFILYEFTSLFISLLEKKEIDEVSDILYEFFDFLKPPDVLNNLMTLIINSLSSKNSSVQKGASIFLITLITFRSDDEKECDHIASIILHYGVFIVRKIIIGIIGSPSRNFFVFLSDLLYKLSLKFPQNTRNWLLETINENVFLSSHLNKDYKTDFVNKFSKLRTPQKAKELINDFWLKIQNKENVTI
ncbi:hypothetical protein PORY_001040 [Pneumocystis oryctolagi]|uniref:Uncharacterized protein n=1 Tax=Pneumocystis oryctolagi TaxID=42067 RepID=A0ACB7CCL2_9ASCO|nr:hypothetical protein PORY_001040 [Pneumocystis oryctolagi]